jgi:hypothetical protein
MSLLSAMDAGTIFVNCGEGKQLAMERKKVFAHEAQQFSR